MTRRRRSLVAAFVAAAVLATGCAGEPLAHDSVTRLPVAARADAARQVVVTIDDSRAPGLVAAAGATPRALGGTGAYRGSALAQDVARTLARDYRLEWVAAWRIGVLGVHCVVFRLPDGDGRDALLARLRADARVESAQPMQQFTTSAQAGAWNDPYFPLQRSLEKMRVPQAQALATGRAVRVAVIDTGADTRHPDLQGRIAQSANFVDGDAARFRRDRHGTAVAGAIAAAAGNATGIVGVAPGVQLMLLKACWEDAPGSPASCNTLTLAEALAEAIERRAQVINLSLTGPADALLERLVQRAIQAGIVVVAADVAVATGVAPPFPLRVRGVIGIVDADAPARAGAMDPRGQRLAAPGQAVLTTVPGGRYDYVSGTSMSVALASGVVALLLEMQPGLQAARLQQLLASTASLVLPLADADRGPATLDADGAVRALAGEVRSTRVAAGTLRCDSADRSAECR
jgi:subtilisin family serine protease